VDEIVASPLPVIQTKRIDQQQLDDLVRRQADLLADMVEVMRRLSALEAKRGR